MLALAAVFSLGFASQRLLTQPRHLYVANRHGVLRYPLVNGHPGPKPDLTIHGFGWPVACSPDGQLIATEHPSRVGVFALGSTKPSVTVHAPEPTVAGVAQDENGNLFVSNFVDGMQPYGWNIAVYDPTGKPVNDIPLTGAGAITIGPAGEVYAIAGSPSQWAIDVYYEPLTETAPDRTFTSEGFGGSLSGITAYGAWLYVTDSFGSPGSPQASDVDIFANNSQGTVRAAGAYVTDPSVSPLGNVALYGKELFTGVQAQGSSGPVWSVFEFDDGPGKYPPNEQYPAADFPQVAIGL